MSSFLSTCKSVYEEPLHPYSQALISAAPVPDPSWDRSNRILLEGDLPSPANPPSGCRFHTRCPMVEEKCKSEEPDLRDISDAHLSNCHYAEKLLSK